MNTRILGLRAIVLGCALAAAVAASMMDAGAWVTCDDGVMRDQGTCPGPQGAPGPRGRPAAAERDWAAMTIAAGSIPYADETVSAGAAFGTAGGEVALALGARLQLNEIVSLSATVMRSDDETGAGVGIGFGFR